MSTLGIVCSRMFILSCWKTLSGRSRSQSCWAGVMEGFWKWSKGVSENLYFLENEAEVQRVTSRGPQGASGSWNPLPGAPHTPHAMQEGLRLQAAAGSQAGLRLQSSENEQEESYKRQLHCSLTLQTRLAFPWQLLECIVL